MKKKKITFTLGDEMVQTVECVLNSRSDTHISPSCGKINLIARINVGTVRLCKPWICLNFTNKFKFLQVAF